MRWAPGRRGIGGDARRGNQPGESLEEFERGEVSGGVGVEPRGMVEGESPLVVACEEAVEDDEVQVEVGVEAGAEAVQEGDGAEGGIGRGVGGGVPQRSPDEPEQDGEDASDQDRIAGEEGAEPFGEGEHPLAHGHVGDHVIAQVGCDFGHAAGGAGGADAAALAAEGEESLLSAGVTAQAGEAVGEDSAGEVAAEVVLDPGWNAAAVRLLRLGEEGLEVVLDDGVEGRFGGSAAAIDRRGREGGWARRRGHPACGAASAGGLREDRAMADPRGPAGAEEGLRGTVREARGAWSSTDAPAGTRPRVG